MGRLAIVFAGVLAFGCDQCNEGETRCQGNQLDHCVLSEGSGRWAWRHFIDCWAGCDSNGTSCVCGCPTDALPPHVLSNCHPGCSTRCDTAWADCDGNAANGCETNVSLADNCGGCGKVCSEGQACQQYDYVYFCGHSCNEAIVQAACGDAFAHFSSMCAGVISSAEVLCKHLFATKTDPATSCVSLAAADLAELQATYGQRCCGSGKAWDDFSLGPHETVGTCARLCTANSDCTDDPARPICAPALGSGIQLTGSRMCVPNDGRPGHGCAGVACAASATTTCVADSNGPFCSPFCQLDVNCGNPQICCNAMSLSGAGRGCNFCR